MDVVAAYSFPMSAACHAGVEEDPNERGKASQRLEFDIIKICPHEHPSASRSIKIQRVPNVS